MNPVLKRLSEIQSSADVEVVSQIFLQSISSGLDGFSWVDIENIGRTTGILMTYAKREYPNARVVETLVSKVSTLLAPVILRISSEDKIRLVSFFPVDVGMRLVESTDSDPDLFMHMMVQEMIKSARDSVIDKIMKKGQQNRPSSEEAEEAYRLMMDPDHLKQISDASAKEFTRLVNELLVPKVEEAQRELDKQQAEINRKIAEAQATLQALQPFSDAVSDDLVIQWLGEFKSEQTFDWIKQVEEPTKSVKKQKEQPVSKASKKEPVKTYANIEKDKEINKASKKQSPAVPAVHYDPNQVVRELRDRHNRQGPAI